RPEFALSLKTISLWLYKGRQEYRLHKQYTYSY
ncbi:unnamed protein product, partial [marine sediment metagenome]